METTKAKKAEQRVEVFIPRGNSNEDPNFFVSINGKSYILPRGKKSMVPDYVKEEIDRSIRAQEKLDATMDAMIEASKQ